MVFSSQEKKTLALVCETLIPSLQSENGDDERLFRTSAQDLNIAPIVEETIELVGETMDIFQLRMVLKSFENPLLNTVLAGKRKSFSQMTFSEREQVLFSWASSKLLSRRKAFQAFKRLALFFHYAYMPDNAHNPLWQSIQYSGPPPVEENVKHTIQPFAMDEINILETDILIVGSGAGGGVLAGELAEAGFDIIVVEKGKYRADAEFHGREMESHSELYERRGALATADASMTVLAGSTLGGGTTINWSASFRTPDHVLQEWSRNFGFTGATSGDFQDGFDAISKRMNLNTDDGILNQNNRKLEIGCERLGYHVDKIPRNTQGCEDCGFCGYGCPFGAKLGTLKTYLQDAYNRGARIVVDAHVDRIVHQNGKVVGAMMTITDKNHQKRQVTVRCKAVVVSAGAIHTPAILRRSGLQNEHIGKNLHLHPVTAVFATFDEPVLGWYGAPLTRYSKEFANLDGRHYGVTLETAPAHPGLSAASLPWAGARQHKELMQKLPNMANIIVITRDYYGGKIKLNKFGQPILDYKLHSYDANHLRIGMLAALRIHKESGANEVYSPHNEQLMYRNNGSNGNFERYLQNVEAKKFHGNGYALFSAHQMSSCRIAGSPKLGAVKPDGETYEVENLFVADGSVLPTATGVNPMISIMGTAHYLAQQIKSKLSH